MFLKDMQINMISLRKRNNMEIDIFLILTHCDSYLIHAQEYIVEIENLHEFVC